MRWRWLFPLGVALLVVPTALSVYLLWPLPGSQQQDAIPFLERLMRWLPALQVAGGLMAVAGLVVLVRARLRRWGWVGVGIGVALVAGVLLGTGEMKASTVFREMETVTFARGTSEALPDSTLVMGVVAGAEAKAYPMRLLAYHHRVEDTLGGEPIWVTYCTMCRTGKVFKPVVEGRPLHFDLMGAIRYNATFRDRETGSWWYQANGRAVAGPLAGRTLEELRVDQMPLGRWLELHPESQVLQPDPEAGEGYTMFGFDQFDEKRSSAERPEGWQWVVGVRRGDDARAYRWSLLAERRLVEDTVGEVPIAVHLTSDLVSHRVWDRRLGDRVLELVLDSEHDRLVDAATGSAFGFDGVAVEGALAGRALAAVPSTVEYAHAFERFSGGRTYEPPPSPQTPAEVAAAAPPVSEAE